MIQMQRYSSRLPRPPVDDDFWYDGSADNGPPATSGIVVNPSTAMQNAAVIACVKVLAESLAQLPLETYKKNLETNTKELDYKNPVYYILKCKPNNFMTKFEWIEVMMYHLCLRGNSYNLIIPGKLGARNQFIPLNPDNMNPKLNEDYSITYEYTKMGGKIEQYRQDEILHVKALSDNGLKGINPIEMYKNIIGTALATEMYAARFFKNDAKPGGVLQHPGTLGPDAAKTLRRTWMQQHGGVDNAHNIAILEEGMTFNPVGMTNQDAQFLESRRFGLADIARIFRVPQHMIGELERSTNNNITQQSEDFVINTLGPWGVRIENAINITLFEDESNYVKFNFNHLLRGDMFTRFRSHALALQNAFMTKNEVRDVEDLNPLPGGDILQEPFKVGNNSTRGNYDRSNRPAPGSQPEDDESGQ